MTEEQFTAYKTLKEEKERIEKQLENINRNAETHGLVRKQHSARISLEWGNGSDREIIVTNQEIIDEALNYIEENLRNELNIIKDTMEEL